MHKPCTIFLEMFAADQDPTNLRRHCNGEQYGEYLSCNIDVVENSHQKASHPHQTDRDEDADENTALIGLLLIGARVLSY